MLGAQVGKFYADLTRFLLLHAPAGHIAAPGDLVPAAVILCGSVECCSSGSYVQWSSLVATFYGVVRLLCAVESSGSYGQRSSFGSYGQRSSYGSDVQWCSGCGEQLSPAFGFCSHPLLKYVLFIEPAPFFIGCFYCFYFIRTGNLTVVFRSFDPVCFPVGQL